jgi:hypothetical protein
MHNTEDRDPEYILSELFCMKRLEATLYDRTIIKAEHNHFFAQLEDQELSVVSWADWPLEKKKQALVEQSVWQIYCVQKLPLPHSFLQ